MPTPSEVKTMWISMRRASLSCLFLASATGCTASTGGAPEPTAQASLAVTTVPQGVQCIQVTVAGSSTVSQDFTVTGGQASVNLALGDLPLGYATVTGAAFGAACNALSGVQPTWVADSQWVDLRAGEDTALTLDFREVLPSTGTANFVGTATQIAVGSGASVVLLADGTQRFSGSLGHSHNDFLGNLPWSLPAATLVSSSKTEICVVTTSGATQCAGDSFPGGTITLSATPTEITVSDDHACVLVQASQEVSSYVYCWGTNGFGQLGNGTTNGDFGSNGTITPTGPGLGYWADVSAGGSTTCAVNGNGGGVLCWGLNGNGQIGDGTTTTRTSPVSVPGLTGITHVSVGLSHTCGLRADGAVFCWGANANGELGDGTTTQRLTPVRVSGITNAVQVVAQQASTCALLSTGKVACWGDDSHGQLGDGTGQQSTTPVTVAGLSGIAWLSPGGSGTHICASNKQDVWCWGANNVGQLADGNYDDAFVPTAMSGL